MSDTETVETEQEVQTETNEVQTETEAQPSDWRSLVTDDDAKKEAERTTDLNAAFRRISELRRDLSTAVRVPGEDADEKEVAAFRKAVGVPDTADEYAFPDLPEEQMTDETKAFRADWAKAFHDLNIPKAAGDALAARFHEQQVAAQEALLAEDKRHADAQEAELKKKWPGEEFSVNKQHADAALAKLAEMTGVRLEDLTGIETKSGRFLLDDANIVQLFAAIGREMQSPGQLGSPMTEGDRDSITSEIDDLQKQIDAAKIDGDNRKADNLWRKKLELIKRRDGDRPIPGTHSRAA